jgi:hypothetical protein
MQNGTMQVRSELDPSLLEIASPSSRAWVNVTVGNVVAQRNRID